jgi:hypothetical protein
MLHFIRCCVLCGLIGSMAIVAGGCGSSSSDSGSKVTEEQRAKADMERAKGMEANKVGGKMEESKAGGGK